MIVNEVKGDVKVSGNIQARAFTIMASKKAFEILSSNIYTNKIRAIIREISCNAKDSHIAAGQTKNFDVHLPTSLESWFSVRDYGTGIDPNEINEIYTTYFYSNKTHSNDYTGMLGLGSKSPLSLVDSFTVKSYYNSMEYIYSVFKDCDGLPCISLLCESDTDKPSGLEVIVSVAADKRWEFEYEAALVFEYFDVIPNINLSSVLDKISERKNNYLLVDNEYSLKSDRGDLFAVMGNVPYLIDSNINSLNIGGFIRFNIGELNFDPGREKLSLDDATKRNIINKIEEVKNSVPNKLLSLIEAEPTDFKKTITYNRLRVGSYSVIMDRSSNVNSFVKYATKHATTNFPVYYKSYRRVAESYVDVVITQNCEYFLHKDKFTTRIREYARNLNGKRIYVLKQSQIDEIGIDADLIKDLDTIPKLQRSSNKSTASRDSNVRIYDKGSFRDIATIPSGEKVYVEVNRDDLVGFRYNSYGFKEFSSYVRDNMGLGEVYVIKSCFLKTKSFKNDEWINIKDYAKRESQKLVKVEWHNVDDSCQADLIADISRHVKNDLFKDYIKLYDEYTSQKNIYMLKDLGMFLESNKLQKLIEAIIEKYPLVNLVRENLKEEELKTLGNIISAD